MEQVSGLRAVETEEEARHTSTQASGSAAEQAYCRVVALQSWPEIGQSVFVQHWLSGMQVPPKFFCPLHRNHSMAADALQPNPEVATNLITCPTTHPYHDASSMVRSIIGLSPPIALIRKRSRPRRR